MDPPFVLDRGVFEHHGIGPPAGTRAALPVAASQQRRRTGGRAGEAGNPKLGGLKSGVGLLVDLGKPTEVGQVRLTLLGSPTSLQILAAPGATPAAPPAPTAWTRSPPATDAGTAPTST